MHSSEGHSDGFLGGYRVLDLTDEKGQLCGRILGDMGADVVKIEPPGGDRSRSIGPFYHDETNPERSLTWFYANANKRGTTLSLDTTDGRDIFRRLLKGADLVIESSPPKHMAKLGLDYDSLAAVKPDIIVTSITPFGQTGPRSWHKTSDLVSVASGGMVCVFGDQDRPPVRITAPQAFFLGGQHGAVGSVLALYHRDLTGEGQWVDVSIQEAVMFSLTYYFPIYEHRGVSRMRRGSFFVTPRPARGDTIRIRLVFECKDGHVCLTLQGGSNRAAVNSGRAIVAWANEEGYAPGLTGYRWQDWDSSTIEQSEQDRVENQLIAFLLTKTKAELLREAARRRILLAPVSTSSDVLGSPQLESRQYWQKVSHPELQETLVYPGPSVQVAQCPQKVYRRAPTVGEHNTEIYQGELGLSDQDLNLLRRAGVM